MRTTRAAAATAAAAMILGHAASVGATPNWSVDDDCLAGGSTYFTTGGPASTVFATQYASSPGGCYEWTKTKSGSSDVNYFEWYLPVTTTYNGNYNGAAFIPCTLDAVGYPRYERWQYGHGGGITEHYYLDQNFHCNDIPFVFTNKAFCENPNTPCGGFVRLGDVRPGHTDRLNERFAADKFYYDGL